MTNRVDYSDGVAATVEKIGEMSWGIDLPGIPFVLKDPVTGKVEELMIHPDSTKPIFEAIYAKLKMDPDYRPFSRAAGQTVTAELKMYDAINHLKQIINARDDEARALDIEEAKAWLEKYDR